MTLLFENYGLAITVDMHYAIEKLIQKKAELRIIMAMSTSISYPEYGQPSSPEPSDGGESTGLRISIGT